MGRPLLSTLVAPVPVTPAPQVRVAEPDEIKLPTFERWSYVNAFDPDSEEFFEGDNVVYEAFLSAEEIAERAQREQDQRERVERADTPTVVRVPVSTQATVRSRLMDLRAARAEGNAVTNAEHAPVPDEDQRPDLVFPTADDSSSSGSDTASSGRVTPDGIDEVLDRVRPDLTFPWNQTDLDDLDAELTRDLARTSSSLARSLPATPTRASWLAESPVVFARPEGIPSPVPPPMGSAPIDIPAPASPVPHPAQAVPPSPMTPPGSVTPRFLTWGDGTRPRAIDMSPSPAPGSRIGSTRASRMSLAYISPPALRVQQ